MAEDKKTIGLTDANKTIMDRVVEKAGFKRDMDAAKFAFALAVHRGSELCRSRGSGPSGTWEVLTRAGISKR
jgi:hypothetical protein